MGVCDQSPSLRLLYGALVINNYNSTSKKGQKHMPRQPTTAEPILDGRALLYTRPDSKVFQVRFKIGRQWVHRSTGHKDRLMAIHAAFDLYARYKGLSDRGVQVTSKTFESVAKVVAAELAKSSKGQDVTYSNYLTNRWIPFFKGKYINNITAKDFEVFFDELEIKLKQKIKNITRRQHYVAINRVFDRAVEQKLIIRGEIPDQPMANDAGSKSASRPAFTSDERRLICNKLIDWVAQGKTKRQREKRLLLRHLVEILFLTGIRPGTETESITFGAVQNHFQDGRRNIVIRVSGKTGERYPVAPVDVLRNFSAVRATIKDVKDTTRFLSLPSGKPYSDPQEDFKDFLIEHGLLIDSMSGEERSLYSCRHTYITQQLLKGVSIYTIANQCGNSVKMIEDYYSKVKPLMSAAAITGATNFDRSVPLPFDDDE